MGEDVSARIRSLGDGLAGLMFIGFGAAAVVIGRAYPMGSAMRMGPGYFPTIVGALLAVLGVAMLARSLAGTAVPAPSFSFKALGLILASVAAFALTVERLGIIAAVVLVVLISSLASERFRWREVLPLMVVMVALAVGLFTKGLGLPFRLMPF
jgi:hypothetical protein